MPDTKITALTALTTADPANDMMPIVDVSDTTMAASGTTKRISINNILACSPSATLASATITGNLTVDTNTLFVDAANNRVGIGTASPSSVLHMRNASGTGIFTQYQDTGGIIYVGIDNSVFRLANTTAQDLLTITQSGVFGFLDGAGGTRMTLNSTGLGVGVTPSAGRGAIQLSAGVGFPATQVASSDANTLDDYEEGSFTPVIEGQTTAGTGTYSIQVGRYTKIGNLVTVQIHLNWTAHTGTGNILIANLPFTSSGVGNLVGGVSIGYIDNLALSAGNIPLAYVLNANTRIQLAQTPTGGGAVGLVPMDTSATIVITGTYMV